MQFNFDISKIPNLIVTNYTNIGASRYVKLAVPFLSLHTATSSWVSIVTGFYEVYTKFQNGLQKSDWAPLALVAGSTALGILSPSTESALSTCLFFYDHSKELVCNVRKGDLQKSAEAAFQIGQQLLYVTSKVRRTPHLRAICLAAEAVWDFYQAVQEARTQNRKPEILSSALLGAARLYSAYTCLPAFDFLKKKSVVLFITSPSDVNGALAKNEKNLFRQFFNQNNLQIVSIKPKDLEDIQLQINELQRKRIPINAMIFNCHGLPVAIKPTQFIIRMPCNRTYVDGYFLENSVIRRLPDPSEYESFDQFVKVIKSGLCKTGKVFILSCSSAAQLRQIDNNFTKSLAQHLPGIEVTGTTQDIHADLISSYFKILCSRKVFDIVGPYLKKYLF